MSASTKVSHSSVNPLVDGCSDQSVVESALIRNLLEACSLPVLTPPGQLAARATRCLGQPLRPQGRAGYGLLESLLACFLASLPTYLPFYTVLLSVCLSVAD